MRHRKWSVRVVQALLLSLAVPAFAQGEGVSTSPAVKECARAYENAQEYRSVGALSSARPELERCRRSDCPEFIRSDCSRWSQEVDAEQPTVIFSAKRGSRALTDVRVSVGNRVLSERLNDRAVELDPGEYEFRFESADGGVAVSHARIQAGNKDRLVQVEFAPAARKHSQETPPSGSPEAGPERPAKATPPAAPVETAPGSGPLPWALLGVGVASVATGVGLSMSGHGDELELRETCAPRCTDAQVAPVHTKYLLSDVSYGVGLVSLSAAVYLFLSHTDSERAAQGTEPLSVVASPSGIQAAYGARF
ncbi:MAG TPA: hypothetical protein VER11_34120 [Polyangiaceae bacterium]|nr:hypothetical protein [Polyangiaceae bacterium]